MIWIQHDYLTRKDRSLGVPHKNNTAATTFDSILQPVFGYSCTQTNINDAKREEIGNLLCMHVEEYDRRK